MEDMTNSTHFKFKITVNPPSHQSLFLFVTSIARTNLEVELVQRNGTLVTPTVQPITPLTPKRDCIGKYIRTNMLCHHFHFTSVKCILNFS